jgi:hypothetical protein
MKDQGPIYENNSKTRGLGEKSTKGIDRGLVSWNWRGLYAKTLGFFWKFGIVFALQNVMDLVHFP